MRFYAACLASYNAGVLHGEWIEASSDAEEMQEAISAMLRKSRFPNVMVKHPETGEMVRSAEEWAVHDHEGFPGWFGEYPALSKIAELVELLEDDHGLSEEAVLAVCHEFRDIEQAKDAISDRFAGHYSSFRDYAEEVADEALNACNAPDHLRNYFDYDSYARDLRMDMTVVDTPDGVAIFHT